MSKMTILCVGIGGYANLYLEKILNCKNPNFEIVGLVDVTKKYCNFVEQLAHIPFYNSMEDFYKEHKADLCIITTPIHFHTRQIVCALENGSNVMCEKPLSANSADENILIAAAKKAQKFVIIGYQWSYSAAINNLKKDIVNGVYGKPQFLKTITLCPRNKEHFKRRSSWSGKIKSAGGDLINDSIANNAAAHYLHNILYVTGDGYGKSSEVVELSADLLRVNDIENFDTAVIKFKLDNGADGLFVASHNTLQMVEPCFEYRFTNGIVRYDANEKMIIGRTNDGQVIEYGDPFDDIFEKIYEAIEACSLKDYIPPCGVETTAPHVRCIEKVQQCQINDANPEYVKENGNFLYVDGLDELMLKCYKEEKLPSDLSGYKQLIKNC